MLVLARKKDSVSEPALEVFGQAAELSPDEGQVFFAENFDEIAGVFAVPGGSGYGIAELTPGDYLLMCPIATGTTMETEGSGPPHFTQGMVDSFTVS